jgi:hypothetical protein
MRLVGRLDPQKVRLVLALVDQLLEIIGGVFSILMLSTATTATLLIVDTPV